MNYNLLEEKWIPVLYRDGNWGRIGICKALEDACRIRQIAASNPMDRVAILRFLLALLYWCKGNPPTDADVTSRDSFPADCFSKLDDNKDCFNLLGEGKRFYQKQVKSGNDRPIGDLLQEFPTETKIAHFCHVRDRDYGLCPACCALGIIRLCAFANAYGQGQYTSAVNGPTPAYAIAQGPTLLQTLRLNWPKDAAPKHEPPWLCNQAPSSEEDLDHVTVFAWRSRQLWLGDLENSEQLCSYCGQPAHLINRLAFTGNWKPPFLTKGKQKKFWDQDPHLILEEVSDKKSKAEEDTDGIDSDNDHETKAIGEEAASKKTVSTLGFPAPGFRVAAHAGFWRRTLSAIIQRTGSTSPQITPLRTIVAGPAANKGLYQDTAAISLPAVSPDAATHTRDVLKLLTSATGDLVNVLRRSTPNPQRQHRNRKAALDALSPLLEAHLREEFDRWLTSVPPPSVESWGALLIEQLRPVVEEVVASTTPGSPFRRREAAQRARQALKEALEKLAKTERKEPTPEIARNPKRGRHKRGGA